MCFGVGKFEIEIEFEGRVSYVEGNLQMKKKEMEPEEKRKTGRKRTKEEREEKRNLKNLKIDPVCLLYFSRRSRKLSV